MRALINIVLATFTFAVAGCASMPEVSDRPYSERLDYNATTQLGGSLRALAQSHPGESGVVLLADPRDALIARVQLARQAQRTLDVQYYIWHGDLVGRHLIREIVQAADRGVRVRLLIDDLDGFSYAGQLALLDQHDTISIRLFNPFNVRNRYALFRRGVDVLVNARRINHRMHNKTFTADNQAAVVGGRNIGDEYFGLHSEHNFRDLDLLLAGPVVDDVSRSFDLFWNSEWAFPVDSLHAGATSVAELEALLAELKSAPEPPIGSPIPELVETWRQLIWCPAEVVYDPPEKLEDPTVGRRNRGALRAFLVQAQEELVVENAYFVPGRDGVEAMAAMVERGVRLRVLTNSLAGNDSAMSHSGYAPYRRRLLNAGVELFELRPDAKVRDRHVLTDDDTRLGLHAKAILIDRRIVFIGTFNLDPRSVYLNTEIGVVLTCPMLAERLHAEFAADFAPESAWRVTLDDRRRLTWVGVTNGVVETHQQEPLASTGRRIAAWFWSLLPLESAL